MAYWNVEKIDVNPLAIIPTLHHSNIPKMVSIESSSGGLPSFGLNLRAFINTYP
jgi:hypothetical protein